MMLIRCVVRVAALSRMGGKSGMLVQGNRESNARGNQRNAVPRLVPEPSAMAARLPVGRDPGRNDGAHPHPTRTGMSVRP
jgi:hypothetical protein